MDKTPASSTTKRAPKRPHSPTDDQPSTTELPDPTPATQPVDVLQSDSRRDKLLRLLGGKKRKNETAASKWLERVRSREDELKVSTELESQFNESLTHKLTGQTRRHIGIGFVEEKPADANKMPVVSGADASNDAPQNSPNNSKTEDITKAQGESKDDAPSAQRTSNNPTYQSATRPAPGPNYQPPPRFPNTPQNGAVGNFAQSAYRNVHSAHPPNQQYGGMGYGTYNPAYPGGYTGRYPNYPPPQPPGWMGGYNPQRFRMNCPPPPPPPPPQGPPQSDPKQSETSSSAPKSKASFYAQFKKAS